jgi:hypothetical protein
MSSVELFRQELRAQIDAIDILINGGEMCRNLRENITAMDACAFQG